MHPATSSRSPGSGPSLRACRVRGSRLIAVVREAGWCVVVISGETEEGVMFYVFGFERVGVVMGDLYFVDPNPLPDQEAMPRSLS